MLGRGTGSEANGDTLISIEAVIATNEDDLLIGNGLANFFNGAAGNDALIGGGGDDTLLGGAGRTSSTAGSAEIC